MKYKIMALACLGILFLSISPYFVAAQSIEDMPPARNSSPIVYDSESDRVVLFGGWKAQMTEEAYNDTWSYDANTNTWTEMTSDPAPGRRACHALTYDEESDRIIMFSGGKSGEGTTLENWNDTWAYDLNTDTWTNMNPPTMPAPRLGAWMAYDSESDVCILFGGIRDGGAFHGDTWAYDYNSNNWTNMNPSNAPSSRVAPMAYDSESDRIILFAGGGFETWPLVMYTDTWAYDYNTNTWTEMNPAENPSSTGDLVYDEESDRVIMFGGTLDWDETELVSETWAYDFNTNTWTEMTPSLAPSQRARPFMTYDSESDLSFLYSGGWLVDSESYNIINDLWTYDYNADTWKKITPLDVFDPVIIVIGIGVVVVVIIIALVFIRRKQT
ncbi:MAG: Kelch repeat-containing protein [Candidatus Thorarchaeota archaeon]